MSGRISGTDSLSAVRFAEAEAVATLHRLNADSIRAFAEADLEWYRQHLSDDFVCTLTDGRRIDKTELLRLNTERPCATDVTYDEVDVHPLGETALVHGVTHFTSDDARASIRYTGTWVRREGHWRAVAAQLTRRSQAMSPVRDDQATRGGSAVRP